MPQPPQWLAVVFRFTSQPFVATPSQLPKPALQVNPHARAAQFVVALARAGHTLPHAPQLLTSALTGSSQPFVRRLPSQSAKPVAQVPVQAPPVQVGETWFVEHAMPQPPHAVAVVLVFVSQPSVTMPLQSRRSLGHIRLEIMQVDAMQSAVAPIGGVGHTAVGPVQEPQWVTFPEAVLVSQPLLVSPSQSPKPGAHEPAQAPATHALDPLSRGAQALPHIPQCAPVVVRSVSQPLTASPSQFPQPVSHTIWQTPLLHAGVACARAGHALPQTPQWVALRWSSTSQPLAAMPSQSPCAVGAVQRRPQRPASQVALAPTPVGQAASHRPQLAGSDCKSVQRVPQVVVPAGQEGWQE